MKKPSTGNLRRVAISLELDCGYKRHLEVYAGCQKYADEAGWLCTINPAIDRMITRDGGSQLPYDGIIARATKPIADAARQTGVPLVNVWMNSPVQDLPSVFPDFDETGMMAAAMLDLLMSGQTPPASPEFVAPAELVPRQSTDVLAVDDLLVSRALGFISENGHHRIQVKHVAAAVAATRRTLERKFRDSVGRSIATEIARLRIQRAKRRMVETDASMKDVATDTGFRSADHFYKVFTRVEGMPPSQYRDQRQKAFPERV